MIAPHFRSHLFQVVGRPTAPHVEIVNQQALHELLDIIDCEPSKMGTLVQLRAPHAGYGKSHLLCRANQLLSSRHQIISLQSPDGRHFDAISILENILTQLTLSLPAGAGLTGLDVFARKLLAAGLEPLIRSGEVPCEDRDLALLSLIQRPLEIFDFHHPAAATAHWTQNHFALIRSRMATEISDSLSISIRHSAFWLDTLFRYASAPIDDPMRVSDLFKESLESSVHASLERLLALLHLMTQWQRVVILVDELEGLSAHPSAALRLASLLTSIRHGAERVDIVLSLNEDIWQNAFAPQLSEGLRDRLTEKLIILQPLNKREALALLKSRYPDADAHDLAQLNLPPEIHARGLLSAAASQPASMPIPPVVIPSAVVTPEVIATSRITPTQPLIPPSFENRLELPPPIHSSTDPSSSFFALEDDDFGFTPSDRMQEPIYHDRVETLLNELRRRIGNEH